MSEAFAAGIPTPAPDFEGELPAAEVMQDELPPHQLATVPVTVVTPVQVRELPSKNAAARTVSVDTYGNRILTKDPRRKRAALYSFDQEITFGPTQAAATARWPKQVPLYLDTRDEVWVKAAATPGTNTDVTVITEAWAQ